MEEKIKALLEAIASHTFSNKEDIESFRETYIGKKSEINKLFAEFKSVPKEEKGKFGKLLNELKQKANTTFSEAQAKIESQSQSEVDFDLTLPASLDKRGARHPLSIVSEQMINIFKQIGFEVAEGPEIEDDWHNFSALNFEDNHPARDMQDTFFVNLNPEMLLRTHTSSVQIRVMEQNQPPIRILAPGRVYRNETVSARSHVFFHQLEGLVIDKNVSFADLRQVIDYFAKQMFGEHTKVRFRPSYFPFTEISGEVDISCLICQGEGCPVCKYSGWVEVLGCGMVDPNVLENCGIDPDIYSGYAFGMGIDRITQLMYRIPDLRLFAQNDIRFLDQFKNIQN